MIFGIGIDIIEVNRLREAFDRFGDKILMKIFTDEEIKYCKQKKDPFHSLAARFAVKEAMIKALKLNGNAKYNIKEIELQGNHFGKKNVVLHGSLLKIAQEKNIKDIHVSISHERQFAVAQIVLETNIS